MSLNAYKYIRNKQTPLSVIQGVIRVVNYLFFLTLVAKIVNNIGLDQTANQENLIKVDIICHRDKINLEAYSENNMGQDQITPFEAV